MKWTGNKENQRVVRKAISKSDGTTLEPVMNVGSQIGRHANKGQNHFISYEDGSISMGSHDRPRRTRATNRQKPRKR